jgi:hypothetical protein
MTCQRGSSTIHFASSRLLAPCCIVGRSTPASQMNGINIDRRAIAPIGAHHTAKVAAPVRAAFTCAWLIQSCKGSVRIHVRVKAVRIRVAALGYALAILDSPLESSVLLSLLYRDRSGWRVLSRIILLSVLDIRLSVGNTSQHLLCQLLTITALSRLI